MAELRGGTTIGGYVALHEGTLLVHDANWITSGTVADARLPTNLARTTQDSFFAAVQTFSRSAAGEAVLFARIGSGHASMRLDANGRMSWGPATSADTYDTTLYRDAADSLRTDDTFTAGALKINGTSVLTSARVLENVALSAALITGGTLAVARGGTGLSNPTAGRLLVSNGANTMALLAPGTAGQVVRSTGSAWASAQLQYGDLGGIPTTFAPNQAAPYAWTEVHTFAEHIGVGTVTIPAWNTAYKGINFSRASIVGGGVATTLVLSRNAYFGASQDQYIAADEASRLILNSTGGFDFQTAPSGAAGGLVPWADAFNITNGRQVLVGTIDPTGIGAGGLKVAGESNLLGNVGIGGPAGAFGQILTGQHDLGTNIIRVVFQHDNPSETALYARFRLTLWPNGVDAGTTFESDVGGVSGANKRLDLIFKASNAATNTSAEVFRATRDYGLLVGTADVTGASSGGLKVAAPSLFLNGYAGPLDANQALFVGWDEPAAWNGAVFQTSKAGLSLYNNDTALGAFAGIQFAVSRSSAHSYGMFGLTRTGMNTGDFVWQLRNGSNPSEVMRLTSPGVLLVGTTDASGVAAGGLKVAGDIIATAIRNSTLNGADTGITTIASGGGATANRGAYIQMVGNDYGGTGSGLLNIVAGNSYINNIAEGAIHFYTGDVQRRMMITAGGVVAIGTTDLNGVGEGGVKVAGTSLFVGNVGMGSVSLSSWRSEYRAVEFFGAALFGYNGSTTGTGTIGIVGNGYLDSAAWKYKSTGVAVRAFTNLGDFRVESASSGSVGTTISWVSTFSVYNNGNGFLAGSWSYGSDWRLKENITALTDATETLRQIQFRAFTWKSTGDLDWGVIAQELSEVPRAAHLVSDNGTGSLAVRYNALSVLAATAVQEVDSAVRRLETEVATLRNRVAELEGHAA